MNNLTAIRKSYIQNAGIIFALNVMAASITPVAFGMYYACLPKISEFFTDDMLKYPQFIFLPYLIGIAISQLVYGTLSDFYGRRPIVLVGLFIFIIGSISSLMTTSPILFMVSRALQGLGIGYTGPLSRAIQRDIFEGKKYFVWGSYMTMILSLIGMFSPMIASLIEQFYPISFHATVYFIIIYTSCVYFIAFLFLPETNYNMISQPLSWNECCKRYSIIIKNYNFLRFAICGGMLYASELIYCTSSPFIFKVELECSVLEYGWITWLIVSGYCLGGLVSSQLNKTFYFHNTIILGLIILLFSTSITICLSLIGYLNIPILILLMWFFMLAGGMVSSNLSLGAIHLFKNDSGFASSLYCSFQLITGSLAIIIAYIFNVQSLYHTILFLFIISLIVFTYLFGSMKISPKLMKLYNY